MSAGWGLVIYVFMLALVASVALWFQDIGCHRRWPGREVAFNVPGGCMVKTRQGWVAETAVRVID